MPSRDSTGQPLSGAACRRQAAARRGGTRAAGGAPPPAPLQEVLPPPAGEIDEGVLWAARIQAAAACRARAGEDPVRVRALGGVVQQLGKLRSLALDSEGAVRALRAYRGEAVDVRQEDPPEAPLGLAAWAWWQLAALLYEVARHPGEVDEGVVRHRARALVVLGAVFPHRELQRLTAELEREQQES
jgi:hypothetical protein